MFIVTKRMEIAGSHFLALPYESKCRNLHGHNWIIEVEVSSEKLDPNGMVIDFTHIKKMIHDKLDHQNLSKVHCPSCAALVKDSPFPEHFNPTAENIAKWIADELDKVLSEDDDFGAFVSMITIQESEGNTACYIP